MPLLSHLTVIDLTANTPGPFCSSILGDLGARVIKVEPPGGDPLRVSAPDMFAQLNRGKMSVALNLKSDAGRQRLRTLVEKADIVLEGSRPGVAKRLGADFETLSAINPGIVYCSISGFGQDGPWRDRPGHDLNYVALSGYLAVQSAIEGRPYAPAVLISDMASGLYAAVAVLAAVAGRTASGKGAYLDLSMAESALAMITPDIGGKHQEGRFQPNVTAIPTYGLFLCRDGKWISLGIVNEDHFWERFCKASGFQDLAEMASLTFHDRMMQTDRVRAMLGRAFWLKGGAEWEAILQKADVPAALVTSLNDVFSSAQFLARGVFTELAGVRYLSQPFKVNDMTPAPAAPPPAINDHEAEVFVP
ncbi:MAG: CoA transferase [SAR202 cluster bacterium]|nr:CoA transferase [SAR202 cluster bacterium]